jgi:hypothetical protein
MTRKPKDKCEPRPPTRRSRASPIRGVRPSRLPGGKFYLLVDGPAFEMTAEEVAREMEKRVEGQKR